MRHLVGLSFFLAASAASAAPHQTPLMTEGSRPVVLATVPGRQAPLRLVVDTAAGATVLDVNVIKALNPALENAQSVQVQGAGGASSHSMYDLKGLTVADRTVDLSVVATDMSPFAKAGHVYDGILGNDMLRRFNVRFDMPAGVLALDDPAPIKPTDDCVANAVAGRSPELAGFGFLDAGLPHAQTGAAVQVRAVLDTGSPYTILNWPAATAMGLTPESDKLTLLQTGTGGFDARQRVQTATYPLPSLTLGRWTTGPAKVRISPLPVFKAIGLDDQPALILGLDMLRQKAMTISAGAQMICVSDA